MTKKIILAILFATIWISISEFVRNSFLVHKHWVSHYQKIGLTFPEQPVNGAIWGIWSLCFAITIYIIAQKFSLIQTTLFSWFIGFVLMWLVIGNMGVLPIEILSYAIPLSMFEVYFASWIIKKMTFEKNVE